MIATLRCSTLRSRATAACQSDFMAVGGGMALDQPSVPIREKCGLGQISGYVVSDASDLATDQVDPSGINTDSVPSGWFGALAKAYPQAVKAPAWVGKTTPPSWSRKRSTSSAPRLRAGTSSTSLSPRSRSTDWAPYVEGYQSKGAEALWPADTANIAPFTQAMATAGYHPAFVALGTQFANSMTQQAVAANPSLPPVYVETSWWPLSIASQNPSTEQLVKVMHTYAKGDTIDFDDEEGAEAWLLWAKSASACTQPHGDVRAQRRSRREELERRRNSGADCKLDALQREPPAFAVLRPHEGRTPRESSTTRRSRSRRSPSGIATPRTSSTSPHNRQQQLASL